MTSIATNDEAQTFQVATPASPASSLTHLPNGASLAAGKSTNLNWEEYARLNPVHLTSGAVVVTGQSTQLGTNKFLVQIPLNYTQLTATDPILTYTPVVHPDTPGKKTFTINSFLVVEQTPVAAGSIVLSLKIGATPVTGASVTVAVASRAPGAWIAAAAPSAANTGTTGVTGIKLVGATVTPFSAGRVIAQMVLTYA